MTSTTLFKKVQYGLLVATGTVIGVLMPGDWGWFTTTEKVTPTALTKAVDVSSLVQSDPIPETTIFSGGPSMNSLDVVIFASFVAVGSGLVLRNLFTRPRPRSPPYRRRNTVLINKYRELAPLPGPDMAIDQEAQITRIIRIAAALHRKVPADLVPIILEHAEQWVRVAVARSTAKRSANGSQNGMIVLACTLPDGMPNNSVRRISFTVQSRWQYTTRHPSAPVIGCWFDAGVRTNPTEKELADLSREDMLGEYVKSKKDPIVRMCLFHNAGIHDSMNFHQDDMVWNMKRGPKTRRILKGLRGGDRIELIMGVEQGYLNYVKFASIEVEGVCVRRL